MIPKDESFIQLSNTTILASIPNFDFALLDDIFIEDHIISIIKIFLTKCPPPPPLIDKKKFF
jgi:hypothetical protein